MRDMNNITTLDLHLLTQEVMQNGVRTSVYLQTLLESNSLENVVVRSAHRKYHDVGSWCFLGKKSFRLPKTVQVELHRPERAKPIQNLVREVITMACTDKTAAGAGSKLADFAIMVDFCNTNDLTGFLDAPDVYHHALREFTAHLQKSSRKEVTQAKLQSVTIECGSYLFPNAKIHFHVGIERILSIADKKSSTRPPAKAPVTRFVNVFNSVFNELTDFVLKKKSFPHVVAIDGERAVITTEAFAFLTQSMAKDKPRKGPMSPYVDYTSGRCMLWSQVHKETPNADYKMHRNFMAKSINRLSQGNTEMYCQKRRRLQKLAHDSFVALFAIHSGENESTIISTPWDGAYEVNNGENGKRIISIKHRGGVQPIQFIVSAPFIKYFRKFLELRSHILDGQTHTKLFVGFDYRSFNGFRQLDENSIANLCMQMKSMVDPAFPKISYKKLRAYKDFWIVENYDVDTSAALLHHSEKTQRDSYTNVEEREAIDSVVKALSHVVKMFKKVEDTQVPSGFCSGVKPTSAVEIPPGYEPDCKNSKGCIFCTEYRATADSETIHKLYSMGYVIKKFLGTCDDLGHFTATHQPALDRIEQILERILALKPELSHEASTLRKQVYEKQVLTEYWENYISRFIRIGALR